MIRFVQLDLIVTKESIHIAQQLVPSRRVHEEIDSREWVAILQADYPSYSSRRV